MPLIFTGRQNTTSKNIKRASSTAPPPPPPWNGSSSALLQPETMGRLLNEERKVPARKPAAMQRAVPKLAKLRKQHGGWQRRTPQIAFGVHR